MFLICGVCFHGRCVNWWQEVKVDKNALFEIAFLDDQFLNMPTLARDTGRRELLHLGELIDAAMIDIASLHMFSAPDMIDNSKGEVESTILEKISPSLDSAEIPRLSLDEDGFEKGDGEAAEEKHPEKDDSSVLGKGVNAIGSAVSMMTYGVVAAVKWAFGQRRLKHETDEKSAEAAPPARRKSYVEALKGSFNSGSGLSRQQVHHLQKVKSFREEDMEVLDVLASREPLLSKLSAAVIEYLGRGMQTLFVTNTQRVKNMSLISVSSYLDSVVHCMSFNILPMLVNLSNKNIILPAPLCLEILNLLTKVITTFELLVSALDEQVAFKKLKRIAETTEVDMANAAVAAIPSSDPASVQGALGTLGGGKEVILIPWPGYTRGDYINDVISMADCIETAANAMVDLCGAMLTANASDGEQNKQLDEEPTAKAPFTREQLLVIYRFTNDFAEQCRRIYYFTKQAALQLNITADDVVVSALPESQGDEKYSQSRSQRVIDSVAIPSQQSETPITEKRANVVVGTKEKQEGIELQTVKPTEAVACVVDPVVVAGSIVDEKTKPVSNNDVSISMPTQ